MASFAPEISSAADRMGVDGGDDRVPLSGDPIKPAAYLRDEIPDLRPQTVEEMRVLHSPVSQPPAAEPVIVERREVKPVEPTTISGPSFLGLTGGSASDDMDYLLQDDTPSHRGGWIAFAVIAIAVFAGIGWLEWDTIKSGKIKIPYFSRANTAADTSAPAQPTGDQAATAANGSATAKTPGESDEKLVTGDTGSNSPAPQNSSTPANATDTEQSAAPAPAATPPATGDATKPEPQTQQSTSAATTNEKPAATDKSASKSDEAAAPSQPAAKTPSKSKPSAKTVAADETEDPRQNKMLVLGEKYLYGRGVPQNCNQALVYFRAAAEQANAPAMSHLGAMYSSGQCVTMSRTTAYKWFARAQNADPGNQWREKNMNMLWREMTAQERASVSR